MLKHPIKKIEWLIPIPDCTLEKAKTSNLASIRIRSALSAEAFSELGLDVSFSDGHDEANADVVFIGKIDNISDPSRSSRWLNHATRLKSAGCHIVVDYTDHHLNTDGPNKNFYQHILKIADTVTCSSRLLAKHLSNCGINNPIIIHDPIEVDIKLPKYKSNQVTTALWFGHATNFKYLVEFLKTLKDFNEEIHIIGLTNAYPIPPTLIEDLEKVLPSTVNISFIPWSIQNLIDASTLCDCAIIPAGVNDERKSGASSNRLLTSLALGLPTFADPLDSYLDFQEYFHELSSNSLLEFCKARSISSFEKLITGQDVVKNGYTFSALSTKWKDLLENLKNDTIARDKFFNALDRTSNVDLFSKNRNAVSTP